MAKGGSTKTSKRGRLSSRTARAIAKEFRLEAGTIARMSGKALSLKPSDTATGSGKVRFRAMGVIERLAGGNVAARARSAKIARKRKAG